MNKISKTTKEEIIDKLVGLISKYCDKCGSEYHRENMNVLKKFENLYIVHMYCDNCKTSTITYVANHIGINNKITLVSDLSKNEIEKLSKASAITSNDILDIDDYLSHMSVESLQSIF